MHANGSSQHYIITHVCHWQTFTNSIIMQIHVDFIRITHHMHLRGQHRKQKATKPDPFLIVQIEIFPLVLAVQGKFPTALPELKRGSKSDTFWFSLSSWFGCQIWLRFPMD